MAPTPSLTPMDSDQNQSAEYYGLKIILNALDRRDSSTLVSEYDRRVESSHNPRIPPRIRGVINWDFVDATFNIKATYTLFLERVRLVVQEKDFLTEDELYSFIDFARKVCTLRQNRNFRHHSGGSSTDQGHQEVAEWWENILSGAQTAYDAITLKKQQEQDKAQGFQLNEQGRSEAYPRLLIDETSRDLGAIARAGATEESAEGAGIMGIDNNDNGGAYMTETTMDFSQWFQK